MCDVSIEIRFVKDQRPPDFGRYKWPREKNEKDALREVLAQYTREELDQLLSVTMIPNSEHIVWLPKTHKYTF
jgi:hypothetical protein